MTYALGLDNSDILPPFFPVARNSDGVFGIVLRMMDSRRYIGHLPFGVIHRNPDGKPFPRSAVWRDSVRVRISDIIAILLRQYPGAFKGVHPSYSLLGDYFIELATVTVRDLFEILRKSILAAFERRASQYESLVKRFHRAPGYWAEDIGAAIALLRRSTSDRFIGLPCDLSSGHPEVVLKQTRSLMAGYGALLRAWPALRRAAETLKKRDPSPHNTAYRGTR